jgi:hypothetical protein
MRADRCTEHVGKQLGAKAQTQGRNILSKALFDPLSFVAQIRILIHLVNVGSASRDDYSGGIFLNVRELLRGKRPEVFKGKLQFGEKRRSQIVTRFIVMLDKNNFSSH